MSAFEGTALFANAAVAAGEGLSADSSYITSCRRIQSNIKALNQTAANLLQQQPDSAEGAYELLRKAKQLGVETQSLLQRLGHLVEENSTTNPAEKSQKRLMYKKLSANYQAALKPLDSAAQKILQGEGRGTSERQPSQTSNSRLSASGSRHGILGSSDPLQLRATHKSGHRQQSGSSGISSLKTTTSGAVVGLNVAEGSESSTRLSGDARTAAAAPLTQSTSTAGSSAIKSHPYYDHSAQASRHFQQQLSGQQQVPAFEVFQPPAGDQRQEMEFLPFALDPTDLDAEMYQRKVGLEQVQNDIRGIRRLYEDLSFQISNQSDDLESIEHQMRSATGFTGGAVDDLRTARRYQATRFRRLFYIAFLICAGFILLWLFLRLR